MKKIIVKLVLVKRYQNLISAGIRDVTNSPYNHLAVWVKIFGKWYVVEAEFPIVRLLASDKWLEINEGRDLHFTSELEAVNNPLDYVGNRYFAGIFINYLGFHLSKKLYKITAWKWFNKLSKWFLYRDKKNQEYCFQLGAKVLGWKQDIVTGNDFEHLLIK